MRYKLNNIFFIVRNAARRVDIFLPFVLSVVLLLNSCKAVGPDYKAPDPTMPDAWSTEINSKFEQDSTTNLENYWTIFNDTILNDLIDQARANNKDIKIAFSRIQQTRASLSGLQGNKYPYASLNASAGVTKLSDNGGLAEVAPEGGFSPETHFQLGLNASWELDVFGKFRRMIESGDANFQASVENYYDVMVLLFAELTSNYINVRVNQQRIIIANENVATQEDMLALTTDRYESGLNSYLDVVQATSNLKATQASIPEYEIEIHNSLNQISVLTGVLKDSLNPALFKVDKIPAATESVTTGIPINLLRQRPDIRAAERTIAMYNAQIGANTAELYPSFNLMGFFGLGSSLLSNFFTDGGSFYGASFPIKWQVFNRAQIKANIAVSEELTEQSLLDYENTVLKAIAEVDYSIAAYNLLVQRQQYLFDAVEASKEAVSLVLIQYEMGLTDFQNVLDTQRGLFNQQDNLITSEGNATTEMVSLYKALGGGWKVDTDTTNTALSNQ